MPANLENSAVITGLEKVSFHSNPKEQQCQRMFKLSSVQLLSHVQLSATPQTAARQASLSITSSWHLLKLMSIESVMPSNHLILCCPLLLPPSTQRLREVRQSPEVTQQVTEWAAQGMADSAGLPLLAKKEPRKNLLLACHHLSL